MSARVVSGDVLSMREASRTLATLEGAVVGRVATHVVLEPGFLGELLFAYLREMGWMTPTFHLNNTE